MTTIMTAEAVIKARDATGGTFGAIANKIARISNTAANASRAASLAVQKGPMIERVTAGMGRQQAAVAAASARVLAPAAIAYGAAQAFKRYANTDMAITRIGITAEATQTEVESLRKSLRDLAFSSGKGFDEVTSGLDSMVASGQTLGEAMKVLPAVTKTAQASGSAIGDIANTAVALQQSLDIKPEKLQDAFDILNTAGKSSKFELKDLARYMASIGPAAKAAGFQGEEGLKKLAAMMETIRTGTGTSEEAADSMINILQKMESTETANKFEKMGVDLPKEMAKARKEGRNLVEAFIDIAKIATKGDLSKLPQLIGDLQFARGTRALMSYGDVYADVMEKDQCVEGFDDGRPGQGAGASEGGDRQIVRELRPLERQRGRRNRSGRSGIRYRRLFDRRCQLVLRRFEATADYYAKSDAEKACFNYEKRRRSGMDPEIRELEQKIDLEEKAEKAKTGPSWIERRFKGKKEIEPLNDRLRNSPLLQKLRKRLFELKAARDVELPGATPIMSEAEIKAVLDEAERKRVDALPQEFPTTAKSKRKAVPLPLKDPRYPMQLPAAGDDAERVEPTEPAAATRAPVGPAPDLSGVWTKGTRAVEHLDGSQQAAGAGAKTGEAYKAAVTTALDAVIRAKVQSWTGMLSFTASPTITPKIGAVPSSNRASLDSANASTLNIPTARTSADNDLCGLQDQARAEASRRRRWLR